MQGVTVGLDLAHQNRQVCLPRCLDHLLDDVVPVLVLDHRPQRGVVRADLGYEASSLIRGGVGDALLHHVAGKLVLGQHQHSALQSGHNLGLVGGLAVVQDVLDHVVPVLVQDQLVGVDEQLGEQDFCLILAAMLQQSLDDSAPVGMARNVESLELCIPLSTSFYKTILVLLPSRHNDLG